MRQKIGALLKKYPFLSFVTRSLLQPRHFQLYSVGAAKTGTVSISNMFGLNFRVKHEPMYLEFADLLENRRCGDITDKELRKWFRKRDQKLWLECEVSHPITWFSDILQETFPKAKFILTVRDCYSWLDSIINQHLNYIWDENSMKLRDILFDNATPHETQVLKNLGLYSLDGYISYWAGINNFILNCIPSERLLIIPTFLISENIDRIADFAGVSVSQLDNRRSHSHKAPKKHNVLKDIDKSLITYKIESICQPVIQRLNGFETLEDYNLYGLPK